MKKILVFSLLASVLTACTSIPKAGKIGKAQQSIASTQWVLADGVKGKSPVLNVQETKVSGNAGCNNYSAELILNPSQGIFSVKNISATRMSCDNISVEKNFLSILSSANRYLVSGNVLELYKDNLLLMKLNKKP